MAEGPLTPFLCRHCGAAGEADCRGARIRTLALCASCLGEQIVDAAGQVFDPDQITLLARCYDCEHDLRMGPATRGWLDGRPVRLSPCEGCGSVVVLDEVTGGVVLHSRSLIEMTPRPFSPE